MRRVMRKESIRERFGKCITSTTCAKPSVIKPLEPDKII